MEGVPGRARRRDGAGADRRGGGALKAPDLAAILDRVVGAARTQGRDVLLEDEGLAIAAALGLRVPRRVVLDHPSAAVALSLATFPGERVVVKALAPDLLHRSDVGGIRIVPRERDAVARAVSALAERLAGHAGLRFLVEEFVEGAGPGAELLLGMRVTQEFGPVVTLGPGGVQAEMLAASMRPDRGPIIVTPALAEEPALEAMVQRRAFLQPALSGFRGEAPFLGLDGVRRLLAAMGALGREAERVGLAEFELNPVLLTGRDAVAVDALGRLGAVSGPGRAHGRDRARLARLLRPASMAIVGVSARVANPGRVILRNVLAAGFNPGRITVIKPGVSQVDGCRAVPDVASLSEPVDLLVASIGAGQVPALVDAVVAGDLAAAMIVTAGGMDTPTGGGLTPAAQVRASLDEARARGAPTPVVNGPNCLGVRSWPGSYDTLFIPHDRLATPAGPPSPVALVSQSGAFAIARASRLSHLNPRYLITVGNQLDLTMADYLDALLDDEELVGVGCYVEGFRAGDGRAFLEAAARWRERGGFVVLYRAGRTPSGAQAAASHTASVAGDYAVTRELARAAGVIVADTLADFEDLLQLRTAWADRPTRPDDPGLAIVSNAGFECVAAADRLAGGRLADLSEATRDALAGLVADAGLEALVPAGNPLDLTPMMNHEGFVEAVRLVLADDGVGMALVGCVPLTPALDLDALAEGLARLWRETRKPWAVVVDAGRDYDPFRGALRRAGIPVLDHADQLMSGA